jgi:hypothetical protein
MKHSRTLVLVILLFSHSSISLCKSFVSKLLLFEWMFKDCMIMIDLCLRKIKTYKYDYLIRYCTVG